MTIKADRRAILVGGLAGGIGAAGPGLLAAPALASGAVRWRMATAWPAKLPGPGVSAERLAQRIGMLSGGRLTVALFPAGALVPAFGVFDAVSSGGVEMGHAAGAFWAGKRAAAPLFTAAPFGLAPWEHLSWIEAGGGQAQWDALYADFGLRAFLGGNTGPSMGGWFRREIRGLDDLKGLKMRIAGLGGQVMAALGVSTLTLPPGELFGALNSGVVDAAEFAGPAADAALGLDRAARYYYGPGFHEPNGASEALVSRAAFDALPGDLQAIVVAACREEHAAGLAEAERADAAALAEFEAGGRVDRRFWPDAVVRAAAPAAAEALETVAAADPLSARVVDSYRAALNRSRRVSEALYAPYLAARG